MDVVESLGALPMKVLPGGIVLAFEKMNTIKGVDEHVFPTGYACNLLYSTLDAERSPSQGFRSLFLQETIRRGVLMPSLVVGYSHGRDEVERTIDAIDGALEVYARALDDGFERHLVGPPSRVVSERRWA